MALAVPFEARAESCHPAYDEALQRAKATGNRETVREVERLPHLAIRDVQGNVLCEVMLSGDLADNPYKGVFERMRDWRSQLATNDAALEVILHPERRDAYEAQLRRIDFAGVRVGDSLQTVFDTLRRQHYVSLSSGPQVYQGVYHYEIDCGEDTVQYNDGSDPAPTVRAQVCSVGNSWPGPLKFRKTDENGTRYDLTAYFTNITDPNRANALRNSRVYEIEAQVSLKAEAGQEYYERLATERYGPIRKGEMPLALIPQLTYGGTHDNNWDEETGFKIEPKPDGLSILVRDYALHDIAYDDVIDANLAKSREAVRTTPKPRF